MKVILLSGGHEAKVDDEDYEYLSQWKWHYAHGYARRNVWNGAKEKPGYIYMHRLINDTPQDMVTDHIDRDGLNNTRANLRSANKRLNSLNRWVQTNNTSGYKGVSWNKALGKWESSVWEYRKKRVLGYFDDLEDAAAVRARAEKEQLHDIIA